MWYVLLCVVSLGWAQTALEKEDHLSWLLIEEAPAASGLVVRRITPKSVFVAPSFCAEGYRQDAMGRCVKVVRVNQAAQWDFLLHKLNSMYAPEPSKPVKKGGPIHLALPIAVEPATTTTQAPVTSTTLVPSTTTDPPTTTTKPEEEEIPTSTTELPTTTIGEEDQETEESATDSNTEESSIVSSTTDLASTTLQEEEPPASTTTQAPMTVKVNLGLRTKCRLGVRVSQVTDSEGGGVDCEETTPAPPTTPRPTPRPPYPRPKPERIRFPDEDRPVRFPQDRRRPLLWPYLPSPHSYPPDRRVHSYRPQFWPDWRSRLSQ
jgi:hypothetical protein